MINCWPASAFSSSLCRAWDFTYSQISRYFFLLSLSLCSGGHELLNDLFVFRVFLGRSQVDEIDVFFFLPWSGEDSQT